MGKVELELGLVEKAVAEAEPVGEGRKDPNHSPNLPKPDRPVADRHWITSRCALCKSMVLSLPLPPLQPSVLPRFPWQIWNKFKWWIILGVVLFVIAIVLFILISTLPQWFK